MSRVYVVVDGIEDVVNALIGLGDKAKSTINECTDAGAEYLTPLIVSAIPPKGEDDIHLRDNIKMKKAKKGKKTKAISTINIGSKSAEYAMHLETGTKHAEARPYIRNTVDKENEKTATLVVETLLKKLGV